MSNSHGHTPAAWTSVAIMFVGFLVSGLALPWALEWLFFVGLLVVALGAVVGKVMEMMGMGNTVSYQDERSPDYDGGESDPSPARNPDANAGSRADTKADAPRP